MPVDDVAAAIAKRSIGIVVAQDTTAAFVGIVVQVTPLRVDVAGVAASPQRLTTVPTLIVGDRVLVIRAAGIAGALVVIGKV